MLLAIHISFYMDPNLSGHCSLCTVLPDPLLSRLQILSPLFPLGCVLRIREAYYPWPRFPHCMYRFLPGEEMKRTKTDREYMGTLWSKCSGYQHGLWTQRDLGVSLCLILTHYSKSQVSFLMYKAGKPHRMNARVKRHHACKALSKGSVHGCYYYCCIEKPKIWN